MKAIYLILIFMLIIIGCECLSLKNILQKFEKKTMYISNKKRGKKMEKIIHQVVGDPQSFISKEPFSNEEREKISKYKGLDSKSRIEKLKEERNDYNKEINPLCIINFTTEQLTEEMKRYGATEFIELIDQHKLNGSDLINLDEEELIQLVPKIGPRIHFRSFIEMSINLC
eukprot:TRINITY_DN10635_c0_g1_i1.p1 TRINITY_DN10635_c0_g1~~TRINITY_DN10635_c0_g1_i1.p1  ORF type:complete len:171 (-),score=41.73 TRINITY_DN10635_c0_g1_i1:12-524(-)